MVIYYFRAGLVFRHRADPSERRPIWSHQAGIYASSAGKSLGRAVLSWECFRHELWTRSNDPSANQMDLLPVSGGKLPSKSNIADGVGKADKKT